MQSRRCQQASPTGIAGVTASHELQASGSTCLGRRMHEPGVHMNTLIHGKQSKIPHATCCSGPLHQLRASRAADNGMLYLTHTRASCAGDEQGAAMCREAARPCAHLCARELVSIDTA